ncbi:hypothetical protein DFH29DRAFT_323760 [Suillus ampliporus]|nr:hypothetical protein DFH29DRAFT_323760 [Suillus ampliporus]
MPIFPPTRIFFVVTLHYLLHTSLGSTFELSTTADCRFCFHDPLHHHLLWHWYLMSQLGSFAFADLFVFSIVRTTNTSIYYIAVCYMTGMSDSTKVARLGQYDKASEARMSAAYQQRHFR